MLGDHSKTIGPGWVCDTKFQSLSSALMLKDVLKQRNSYPFPGDSPYIATVRTREPGSTDLPGITAWTGKRAHRWTVARKNHWLKDAFGPTMCKRFQDLKVFQKRDEEIISLISTIKLMVVVFRINNCSQVDLMWLDAKRCNLQVSPQKERLLELLWMNFKTKVYECYGGLVVRQTTEQ